MDRKGTQQEQLGSVLGFLKERGTTQKEVAEHLGMTERAYQRIESGERVGMIEAWDLLEDLFNIHQRKLREISSN